MKASIRTDRIFVQVWFRGKSGTWWPDQGCTVKTQKEAEARRDAYREDYAARNAKRSAERRLEIRVSISSRPMECPVG
jgi:hypothetical protein